MVKSEETVPPGYAPAGGRCERDGLRSAWYREGAGSGGVKKASACVLLGVGSLEAGVGAASAICGGDRMESK